MLMKTQRTTSGGGASKDNTFGKFVGFALISEKALPPLEFLPNISSEPPIPFKIPSCTPNY